MIETIVHRQDLDTMSIEEIKEEIKEHRQFENFINSKDAEKFLKRLL